MLAVFALPFYGAGPNKFDGSVRHKCMNEVSDRPNQIRMRAKRKINDALKNEYRWNLQYYNVRQVFRDPVRVSNEEIVFSTYNDIR